MMMMMKMSEKEGSRGCRKKGGRVHTEASFSSPLASSSLGPIELHTL